MFLVVYYVVFLFFRLRYVMSKFIKLKWKKICFLVIVDFVVKKIVWDEKKNLNKLVLILVSD